MRITTGDGKCGLTGRWVAMEARSSSGLGQDGALEDEDHLDWRIPAAQVTADVARGVNDAKASPWVVGAHGPCEATVASWATWPLDLRSHGPYLNGGEGGK